MEVTKFRSQLFIALEQLAVHLRQAHNRLTRLAASSLDAIAVTNAEIARQIYITFGQVTVHLRQAQNTLIGVVTSVADKPRRLQEEVRTRESNLRKLLASSFDAVVVTDGERRLVAANPMAAHLFGVSEANMRKFAIDAFLTRRQIPYFRANGSPFIGRKKRHGECKIRCLDGSLRVAEYIFIPNFVPFRHLCRFRKYREWPARKPLAAHRKSGHWPH